MSKRDYLGRAFWIPEQDLKDLHSLLSELLETETAEVSNLGFIRQYLGEVPPDRTFTAKELWEVFNAFAPLMSEEIEKKMVESLKNLLDTLTVKEEVPMGASQWMAHGKKYGYSEYKFCKKCFHTFGLFGRDAKCKCQCHRPEEEPTTPEKKCCVLGLVDHFENCQCPHCQECETPNELPNSSYEVTCGMKPSPRERIQAIATELGHSFIRNGQFGRTVHSQAIELYLQEQYDESIKHSC